MNRRTVMSIYELIELPKKRWQFWKPKQVRIEVLSYFNCEIKELEAQQVTIRIRSTQ